MSSEKNKTVTLILCIILGQLGAHRFYVGKIGTGFLWLFTLGLFGVGWLVDFLLIITDKFKDRHGYIVNLGSPNQLTFEQLFFIDTRLFCQIICMLKNN